MNFKRDIQTHIKVQSKVIDLIYLFYYVLTYLLILLTYFLHYVCMMYLFILATRSEDLCYAV